MEEKEPGCQTCKQKSPPAALKSMWPIFLGVYLLIASVYGTIELVKDIFTYFFK